VGGRLKFTSKTQKKKAVMSSLKEQSEKTGAWLFRWRGHVPFIIVAVIIPGFLNSRPYESRASELSWEMACFAISLLGLLIRSYTIGHTPKNTSGRNTVNQLADTLNTTGIYSITRNPLYVGNFIMSLGPTLLPGVWWVPLIYTLAFWVYYERIIMAEEAFLTGKFGSEYERYLNSTPVFIPSFKLWKPPTLSFSFRNVLKREYPGFFALIALFAFFDIVGHYIVEGSVRIDPVWAAITAVGLVVYVILRTLKKKTKLLNVEGR
jgi:protein-S-isoprenylcysteine O-methyltransferase Ste14